MLHTHTHIFSPSVQDIWTICTDLMDTWRLVSPIQMWNMVTVSHSVPELQRWKSVCADWTLWCHCEASLAQSDLFLHYVRAASTKERLNVLSFWNRGQTPRLVYISLNQSQPPWAVLCPKCSNGALATGACLGISQGWPISDWPPQVPPYLIGYLPRQRQAWLIDKFDW